MSLCSDAALQNSTRRDHCSSIVNALAGRGSTLIELVIAVTLAQRLGWSDERWKAQQTEQESDVRALKYPWRNAQTGSGFRCDTVLAYDYFIDALATTGGSERAAMKAAIEFERGASGGRALGETPRQ